VRLSNLLCVCCVTVTVCRCDILFLPCMVTEPVSAALSAAGFADASLTPAAVVDLRAHKNSTWNQYLHSLKKGDRRDPSARFAAAKGEVHIHHVGDCDHHHAHGGSRCSRELETTC